MTNVEILTALAKFYEKRLHGGCAGQPTKKWWGKLGVGYQIVMRDVGGEAVALAAVQNATDAEKAQVSTVTSINPANLQIILQFIATMLPVIIAAFNKPPVV